MRLYIRVLFVIHRALCDINGIKPYLLCILQLQSSQTKMIAGVSNEDVNWSIMSVLYESCMCSLIAQLCRQRKWWYSNEQIWPPSEYLPFRDTTNSPLPRLQISALINIFPSNILRWNFWGPLTVPYYLAWSFNAMILVNTYATLSHNKVTGGLQEFYGADSWACNSTHWIFSFCIKSIDGIGVALQYQVLSNSNTFPRFVDDWLSTKGVWKMNIYGFNHEVYLLRDTL